MEVILFMFCGIIAGIILRKKRSIIVSADRFAGWSVYLLLFLLGVSIGRNNTIISNLAIIGYQSVVLALSAISGSIVFSYIVYKSFFKEETKS